MYSEAYNLIREILNDEQLNKYIFESTGKNLTIINSGPQVDTPAAKILFNGGDFTRSRNSDHDVSYSVEFALPFWGDDAFEQCINFIDFSLPIFFLYGSGSDNRNVITRAAPSVIEGNPENDFWTINITLTIKIFI